ATASTILGVNGSKALISYTTSGSGTVVALTAGPTFTGTIGAAAMTLSSTLGVTGATTLAGMSATTGSFSSTLAVTGVATFTAAPVFSSATASQAMFTNGSKQLVSNALTGSGNVVMSASPTLTGTIGAAAMTLSSTLSTSGLHTASGGIQFAGGGSTLTYYEEGTFTCTLSGCTTAPTGTASYTRVGKQVTIILPRLTGTSNETYCDYTAGSGTVPSSIRPSITSNFPAYLINNGTEEMGKIQISSTGNMSLNRLASASFTSSG